MFVNLMCDNFVWINVYIFYKILLLYVLFFDDVLFYLVLIFCKEGIYKMDVFNFFEIVYIC